MKITVIKWILSGCGLGFLPKMPGTYGSLGGMFLAGMLSFNRVGSFIVFSILLVVSAVLLNVYLREANNTDKDPQFVVIDEVLGIYLVYLFLPFNWFTGILGFILFRLFDIIKPLGIRKLEQFGGAAGIILDDLAAGIGAIAVLKILLMLGSFLGWL